MAGASRSSPQPCRHAHPARHELVVDVVEDGECKRLQRVFRLTGRHREIGRESGRSEQAFVGHIGYLDLERACLTRKEGHIGGPGDRKSGWWGKRVVGWVGWECRRIIKKK